MWVPCGCLPVAEHRQGRCWLVWGQVRDWEGHCRAAQPSRRGKPFVPCAPATVLRRESGRCKEEQKGRTRFENRANAVRRDACAAGGGRLGGVTRVIVHCSSLILGQRRFGHQTFISEFQTCCNESRSGRRVSRMKGVGDRAASAVDPAGRRCAMGSGGGPNGGLSWAT